MIQVEHTGGLTKKHFMITVSGLNISASCVSNLSKQVCGWVWPDLSSLSRELLIIAVGGKELRGWFMENFRFLIAFYFMNDQGLFLFYFLFTIIELKAQVQTRFYLRLKSSFAPTDIVSCYLSGFLRDATMKLENKTKQNGRKTTFVFHCQPLFRFCCV